VKSRFESGQWLERPVEKYFSSSTARNSPRLVPTAMQVKLLNLKLSNAQNRGFRSGADGGGGGSEMVLSFRVVPGLSFQGKWLARITEGESDHFLPI